MKKIAVIAAHPDDEVLGCGATIAKHALQGDEVHILIMAEGATSRSEFRDRKQHADELSSLSKAAADAAVVLGAKSCTLLDFPDNRMDSVDRLDVVKAIEHFLMQHQAQMVYTHHAGDVNIDHQIIHHAVVTACRPQPGHFVETILCFEVASSSEWQTPDSYLCFMPNWFEEVTKTIGLKIQALQCYESEMRKWPHSRSYEALRALAAWRGACVGVEASEAFVLSRMIQRK